MLKHITHENWKKAVEHYQREMDALYRWRLAEMKRQRAKSWSDAHIATYWGVTRQRVGRMLEAE